jgi:hypothetical protein
MMRQFWEISTNNSNRECTRIGKPRMDPPPQSDSTELAERPTARQATNARERGGRWVEMTLGDVRGSRLFANRKSCLVGKAAPLQTSG